MIRRIRVQNFGCLSDVDVELGPLTILLGPNASGKSMFLRALRTLAKIVRSPIRGPRAEFKIDHATLAELASAEPISFAVWLDHPLGEPTYLLELGRVSGLWTVTRERIRCSGIEFDTQQGPFEFGTQLRGLIRWDTPGTPPRHAVLPYLIFAYHRDAVALPSIRPWLEFREGLGMAYAFRANPADLMAPMLPPWIDAEKPYPDITGTGFVHSLRAWHQTVQGERTFRERVLPELRSLFEHVRGIGFRGVGPRVSLEYDTDRSATAVPSQLESDGVNLALFFLCIPYLVADLNQTPLCLGFEEPEAGTHPYLQGKRLELLRKLANGALTGRPIQVIATTHSVELVRWVTRNEALETLRFVEHLGPEGGTRIYRLLEQEEMDRVFEQYAGNPGLAWYSGLFGGVPPRP